MKKRIGILLLSLILIANISFATESVESDNIEFDETEIEQLLNESMHESNMLDDDVYRMEENVTIQQNVNGNVYIMAKDAKIEEVEIYGNVYIMAQKIEIINSDIEGSVYAMGEEIDFSGMANDVYALGESINFSSDAYIWRDARVVSENVSIDGTIERNCYAGVKSLSAGDNAVIEGRLKYFSKEEGNISENAQIMEVQFEQEKSEDTEKQEPAVMKYLYEVLKVAFQALIIVLIIMFRTHKFKTLKRTDNIASDFLKDTGKGALVLIFVPITSILLMISIIGMGFGFVLLALYFILLYISIPVTAVEITHRILAKQSENEIKKGKMIGISIFISVIFWAIKFVPTIGGIIRFIAVLIGLGMITTLIFQKNKKEEINEN